ncbi:unnamed protein product [Hymenolepis diminuta]|uniref:Uncharacterized protein n=1 Tax=Hymenolepis diminuta TaxID=6216 RepID=A0A564Z801_HYMDI|nr:unnamed protein product [Hymenolepis diminuta]
MNHVKPAYLDKFAIINATSVFPPYPPYPVKETKKPTPVTLSGRYLSFPDRYYILPSLNVEKRLESGRNSIENKRRRS